MKYLILDPARLTHLIKSEDQLKTFNAFQQAWRKCDTKRTLIS